LQSSSKDGPIGRANERSNVFLTATLHFGAQSFAVRIRNLSAGGALLDGSKLPGEGAKVHLRRAHLAAAAEIVWQMQELRGLRFSAEIDVHEWMRQREHVGQQRVDRVVDALRRTGVQTESMQGLAEDTPPHADLESLCIALAQISERLANSPALTDAIAEEVLRLEAIILSLRQLTASKKPTR
jgi:hypothetical protein